ncbi:HPF/RaiA family ribosome-associated protein [Ferruginibacter sp. HRS2-29]|uniref:HPF/RaiA family ribosome-associated protein n=1 Tax=Ferruginibacter sp. HRS2-29 TaxID=2487334 RepID=UPI0020CB9496|nr:HPF/RaiA family ribosome-associated protein [Ferruginibacter sp. HRS2-29]MCP9749367.1 HPF/RaiA family ribosome-associated protein [Ferruginibacter sp. HRS2-29]
MLIQINTDKNIEGSEGLIVHFSEVLKDTLGRFDEQITRVEVHLSDENGSKEAGDDKKAMIEARLRGLNPIAVTSHADTIHKAVKAASEKLVHSLEKAIGHQRAY